MFGRVGLACLLCLVSGYSVTAQRRPCQAGHALAPPQGFWKVHISPKCHFNSSELPLMQVLFLFLPAVSLMMSTPESHLEKNAEFSEICCLLCLPCMWTACVQKHMCADALVTTVTANISIREDDICARVDFNNLLVC